MADAKISALSAAGTLDGTETLLLSQSAADAKLTLSTLATFASGWVRPSDWPAMPTTATHQIDILAAVSDDGSNHVAVRATVSAGTYNVDWGDGTSSTGVSSATNAEHTFDYADGDLGALTSRGYKTAMIKITPNTGGATITAFDIGQKHTRTNLNAYSNPWLDVQVNASACTSIAFRGGVTPRMLERVNFVALGAITTLSGRFNGCVSLQSVSFPAGSLTSVTTLDFCFVGCSSLRTVSFPSGSLTAVTTIEFCFQNCVSLQSASFPSGSLALVTSLESAFSGCSSLQSVSFPAGSLSGVTTGLNAFLNCGSVQAIAFPAGSLASITTLSNMFNGCSSVQVITFPTGALGSVTNTTSTFGSCTSLARIVNCTIPVSFIIAGGKYAGTQLDEIYTALPSVAQTITVSTNHGTPDDTPSIATGKGWTVTGS